MRRCLRSSSRISLHGPTYDLWRMAAIRISSADFQSAVSQNCILPASPPAKPTQSLNDWSIVNRAYGRPVANPRDVGIRSFPFMQGLIAIPVHAGTRVKLRSSAMFIVRRAQEVASLSPSDGEREQRGGVL